MAAPLPAPLSLDTPAQANPRSVGLSAETLSSSVPRPAMMVTLSVEMAVLQIALNRLGIFALLPTTQEATALPSAGIP